MSVTLSQALAALPEVDTLTKAVGLDGSTASKADPAGGGGLGYLVYVALLTQTGTDAPVATVLQNTLGGTVVWSRDNTGQYTGLLLGAFAAANTVCFVSPLIHSLYSLLLQFSFPDAIVIYTEDSGVPADAILLRTSLEIRVYP